MPKGNTSNSDYINLYLQNCQNHSIRARAKFRALNHKLTKKPSEDKVIS